MDDLSSSNYVFYNAGKGGNGITVTIGANVPKIPAYLFNPYYKYGYDYSPKIISVVFEDGSVCESIGDYAFEYCTSLKSVTICESITSIGKYAFGDCTALTEINFNVTAMDDLSSSNYVFYNAGQSGDGITVTIGSNVIKIPAYLFSPTTSSGYAPNIISVVFEDGSVCESIGNHAFYYCTSLISVYYSGTVSEWASISFGNTFANPLYYAGNLYINGVILSDLIDLDITSISANAFAGWNVTSITILDSVTSIGSYAFYYCTSLESVFYSGMASEWASISFGNYSANPLYYAGNLYINNMLLTDLENTDIITISDYAFVGWNVTSITIPDSVTSIGSSAFEECYFLTSITIPDSVTSIGSYAFEECCSLTSVHYSGTASQWASISFSGCLANPLYYAGNLYFSGILATDITLEDITTINSNAFYGCTSLTSVTIPDSVTSIGSSAFEECYFLTSITIPDSVTSIDSNAFSSCTSLASLTIGESVTSVDGYAFAYCTALSEINFNATAMDDLSSTLFYDAGKSGYGITVTIGANVTKIPARLFYALLSSSDAPKITSVVFEDGSVCESIGDYAFSCCSLLTSITIPDSVTSIGSYAFYYCSSLTSIIIPESVTSIGCGVFYGCSSLTSVTFEDTDGWFVSTSSSVTSGNDMSSGVLSDSSIAATLLISTYTSYYWYKS